MKSEKLWWHFGNEGWFETNFDRSEITVTYNNSSHAKCTFLEDLWVMSTKLLLSNLN